jgi:hypothetical protein
LCVHTHISLSATLFRRVLIVMNEKYTSALGVSRRVVCVE